ncbi:MAG: tetratricopeptide repeat protein [Candidatus Heimdallarchaeaceae archaeon]
MSFERDKGDELFTKFKFRDALHWYLKAHNIFFTKGREEEKRNSELKIARCLALLGRKKEALQILEDLYFQTRDHLLFEENIQVTIELASTYFLYGDFERGKEWLNKIEEEDISHERPQIYFRYWQIRAQLFIVYHQLEEARERVNKLIEKAQNMGNEPYFHELQVLLAQIDAEGGDVLEAYSKIEKALKYFESTPFERSAFEKKIILSQFVEEPEKTIELIDNYIERYKPEDIQPLALGAHRIELELRAGRITPKDAIENAERVLSSVESIEHHEIAARIRRLLAGLYHTIGETEEAFSAFSKAKEYFISQKLEYEEAVTTFIFLPAFLQRASAKMLRSFENLLSSFFPEKYKEEKDEFDVEKEMQRIKEVFERYGDQVRAMMTQFFYLSYQITIANMSIDIQSTIEGIEAIYKWMLDNGELQYSEMIGNFLELLHRFPER